MKYPTQIKIVNDATGAVKEFKTELISSGSRGNELQCFNSNGLVEKVCGIPPEGFALKQYGFTITGRQYIIKS